MIEHDIEAKTSSLSVLGGIGCVVFRCPGRFFAEMEVALTVLFFLTQFNMQLASCQSTTGQAASLEHADGPGHHLRQTAAKQVVKKLASGDPHGLLPLPETRRQVGIRWPHTVCHVSYEKQSFLK